MARATQRVRGLVVASHVGPTVVVTALGGGLAAGAGGGAGRVALVTAAVLAGQLSVGWSNDWVDAARDRAVRRTGKPVVAGAVTEEQLRTAAFVAAGATTMLSLAAGPVAGGLHVVAVGWAWAYNLRLKRTAWSWLPYAVSFALLPVFCVLAARGAAPPAWVPLTGALLGLGAHLVNVLPDLDDDAATGVRGLPHRLGRRATGLLAPVLLLAGVVVAAVGGAASGWRVAVVVAAVVLAVAAGALALRASPGRAPFALSMAVAGTCAVVLVGAGERLAGA